ncbi:hypothetical protein K1719_031795 [Acacia pycnantha]|nr:hypothetical protein K1719_031795 [Acacia pycnantha]
MQTYIEQHLLEKQGSRSDITIKRGVLWVAASQNKEGNIDNPYVQEAVSRMVSTMESVRKNTLGSRRSRFDQRIQQYMEIIEMLKQQVIAQQAIIDQFLSWDTTRK